MHSLFVSYDLLYLIFENNIAEPPPKYINIEINKTKINSRENLSPSAYIY